MIESPAGKLSLLKNNGSGVFVELVKVGFSLYYMMDLSQIQPVEDNILIEPLERETTTASGIVIPDTAKEKPQQGKVLAVGPGKKNEEGKVIPLEFKVGQMVLYKKWGGNEIKVGGKEYLIVRSEDVLAVIE